MPSRTDTAEHTKVFDYPVMGHWAKAAVFSSASGTRTDNASVHSSCVVCVVNVCVSVSLCVGWVCCVLCAVYLWCVFAVCVSVTV